MNHIDYMNELYIYTACIKTNAQWINAWWKTISYIHYHTNNNITILQCFGRQWHSNRHVTYTFDSSLWLSSSKASSFLWNEWWNYHYL